MLCVKRGFGAVGIPLLFVMLAPSAALAHGEGTLVWLAAPPVFVIIALSIALPLWRARMLPKIVTGLAVLVASVAATSAAVRFARVDNVQWFVLAEWNAPLLVWLVGWRWTRRFGATDGPRRG